MKRMQIANAYRQFGYEHVRMIRRPIGGSVGLQLQRQVTLILPHVYYTYIK